MNKILAAIALAAKRASNDNKNKTASQLRAVVSGTC